MEIIKSTSGKKEARISKTESGFTVCVVQVYGDGNGEDLLHSKDFAKKGASMDKFVSSYIS
jgi:hypothetical protein